MSRGDEPARLIGHSREVVQRNSRFLRGQNTLTSKTPLRRLDVLEALNIAFAGGEDAGQSVKNATGPVACSIARKLAFARSLQTIFFGMCYWSEPCDLGGVAAHVNLCARRRFSPAIPGSAATKC